MFPGSPLTPDRYPIYIYNDAPGRTNSRGRRVVEALSRAYAFTLDDAIGLALDEKWMDTERWLAALRAALDGDSTLPRRSPEFRRVADRLSRFDGVARAGSSAALAYWLWWEALFETPGGFPLARVAAWQATSDPIPTDLAAALIAALERAVTRLGEPSASTDRTLGDLFRIGRGGTTFPIGGVSLVPQDRSKCEGLASFNERCVMTLRAYTAGRPDSAGLRHVEIGSRLLRLVVFGPPFRTYTLHNYGQSERRDSPHYNDQARLSSERRLKQLYFDLEELRPHIRSELTLDVIGVRE
jgi:acyl-homoserine lactone acylase PvdQ